MSRFAEGDKAAEERKRYQKTAKVLTLFIVSYLSQWFLWIVFCLWSFLTPPPYILVSIMTSQPYILVSDVTLHPAYIMVSIVTPPP